MAFHDEGNDGNSYLDKQRLLMANKRAVDKRVVIDWSTVDWKLRAYLRDHPLEFAKMMFPDVFYTKWTRTHRGIADAIKHVILYAVLKAIAAERSGGKSSLAKCLLGVWAVCYGLIKWFVPIEANTNFAAETLADIKSYYEEINLETDDLFARTYPEVVTPIRALEGSTRRHEGQTVNGELTFLQWGTDKVVFPTVIMPDGSKSPASGTIITPKGIDKAIRGLAKRSQRPDAILLNDIETDESARSMLMTQKIKERLDKGVLGLGGIDRPVGVIKLCTIINKRCISAQLTDRDKNPEWGGERYRFIIEWPDKQDLWDNYLQLRAREPKEAYNYYVEHRAEMDAGAVVSNPARFNRTIGPDGKQIELSALQHAYNQIARMGMEAFLSEYQNDPQEDVEIIDIDANRVQHRVNGIPRGVVPDWADRLVLFLDVHGRHLEYVVRAFAHGGSSHVVDYGSEKVDSPLGNLKLEENKQALGDAILTALLLFRDNVRETGWYNQSGDLVSLDLALVDCGYMTEIVYRFCTASGSAWHPYKGWGTSSGQSKYREPDKGKQGNKYKGSHYYMSQQTYQDPSTGRYRKIWVYNGDADYWKRNLHDSFTIPEDRPGHISLFGNDPLKHNEFAKQILSEVWVSEFVSGKGHKEGWVVQYSRNHWLDGTYGCGVAATISGLRRTSIRQLKKAAVAKLDKTAIKNGQTKPKSTRTTKRTKKRKKVTYC